MFKEERDQSQFQWSMLGDLKEGRPNLGPMTHVAVYRLMQFTLRDILIRDFGVEKADKVFFEAGKKAGQEYCKNVLIGRRCKPGSPTGSAWTMTATASPRATPARSRTPSTTSSCSATTRTAPAWPWPDTSP